MIKADESRSLNGHPPRLAAKQIEITIPLHHNIIIVGAGLAGLYAALKLAPTPVTVLTTKTLGRSASSLWAQGGIAAAIGEGDTAKAHAEDTIKAGKGLVNEEIAELVTKEATDRIHDLLTFGVPFDKDLKGRLELSKEAAHSTNRIVRVSGDQAGAAIMAALIEAVKKTPSITVIENISVHKLSTKNDQVNGVYVWPAAEQTVGQGQRLTANAVVLATGGSGALYSKTTNPSSARGEGLAMAAEAGALIADPEFVQFHPTAIDAGLDPAPLATEALRGEAAHLIDNSGHRIMETIHPDMEMAPRDIVARTVFRSVTSGKGAFLDCRMIPAERMKTHYKTVMENCRKAGLNPITTPIPVAPAAHFHMGGIVTDQWGRSSLKGLWACGEVAATGLHGANRLASNSLLEAIVFADRIAKDLAKSDSSLQNPSQQESTNKQTITLHETSHKGSEVETENSDQAIKQLREIMFTYAGLERSEAGLRQALDKLNELEPCFENQQRNQNMLLTARFILVGALLRQHSVGSHFRIDDENLSSPSLRSFITLSELESNLISLQSVGSANNVNDTVTSQTEVPAG